MRSINWARRYLSLAQESLRDYITMQPYVLQLVGGGKANVGDALMWCSYVEAWGELRDDSNLGSDVKWMADAAWSLLVGRFHHQQREIVRKNYSSFKKNLGDKCNYCKLPKEPLRIDHIHPIKYGGPSEDFNLQVLCLECHKTKTKKLEGNYLNLWERHFIKCGESDIAAQALSDESTALIRAYWDFVFRELVIKERVEV